MTVTIAWIEIDQTGSSIEGDAGHACFRAQVPGGWILKFIHRNQKELINTVFVPDLNHDWKTGTRLAEEIGIPQA